MYKDYSEQGTSYDNPDGKPMKESTKYGEAGKVNMLAYMVKNTNEHLGETANINVVSVSYTHLGQYVFCRTGFRQSFCGVQLLSVVL